MRIVIDPSLGEARLEDPDDFTAFSVALTGPPRPEALAEVLRRTSLGRLDEAGTHVVVDPAGLRALAGPVAADAAWDEGLAAMMAYATEKGWRRDGGVVAHIETDGGVVADIETDGGVVADIETDGGVVADIETHGGVVADIEKDTGVVADIEKDTGKV